MPLHIIVILIIERSRITEIPMRVSSYSFLCLCALVLAPRKQTVSSNKTGTGAVIRAPEQRPAMRIFSPVQASAVSMPQMLNTDVENNP